MKTIKIQVEGYKCEGCGNESLNKANIRFCENRHQCEKLGHEGQKFEVENNPYDDDSSYSSVFKIEKRCVKCSSIVERKVFDFSEMSQEVLEKLFNELPEKDQLMKKTLEQQILAGVKSKELKEYAK